MSENSDIDVLEYLEKEYNEFAEEHRKRADLMKGVVLGLLFGILGNLAVQHWYAIFEVLIPAEFLFLSNVVIIVVLFVGILLLTRVFLIQFETAKNWEQHFKEQVQTVRAMKEREKGKED